jgi:hypothetical protein
VVSPLLAYLAGKDLVLAGDCLAGADCLDDEAIAILASLAERMQHDDREVTMRALAALLNATASPRPAVRQTAEDIVSTRLVGIVNRSEAFAAIGGNVEGGLRIIEMLVDRMGHTPTSIILISQLVAIMPDDPRLVAILWRCLNTPAAQGVEDTKVSAALGAITGRLLQLATDPASLTELQDQQRYQPAFGAPERRRAYPFKRGVPADSNLVTLLCWADFHGTDVAEVNEFLRGRADNPAAWARLETDRHRTGAIWLPPAVVRQVDSTPAERLAGGGLAVIALLAITAVVDDLVRKSSVLGGKLDAVTLAFAVAELLMSLYVLGLRPHLGPARRIPLWQSNPLVDRVYEDPRSEHWMAPAPRNPVDGAVTFPQPVP